MQTTTQGLELSVALLMDDLGTAKEISQALRHNDIFAHVYQNLEEYWVGSKLQQPDLTIIDVTKMSFGSVQFKNHPRVLDRSLRYAFFSKDSTKILLQSTIGLSPAAFLHADTSLPVQISSLIQTLRNEIRTKTELQDLKSKNDRLSARSQRLISERSGAEEFKSHFEFIRTLCTSLEEDSNKTDFSTSLMAKLDQWQSIDGYGLYELNQSGQKLISPEISRTKYHPFPSLWLGQINTFGIETFAQDMALQVANDLFEMAPVMIRIHAGSNMPDVLLFVSFKEERMINFPWEVLESSLSSSLRKTKLYRELPQYTSQFLPMWEALDSMDKLQKNTIDGDTRIIALSFIPLTEIAKKRAQNKFYWSAFFNDFFLQLSGRLQKTTKLSLFGPWHVMFFIPKENVESETQMLQAFIKQFSFWKFFEDNSQVLTEQMMPTLRLIPASSAHYLRSFEKEFADVAALEEDKRLQSFARNETRRLTL